LTATQTLPYEPTVSEFEYFLSQAMSTLGKTISFSWTSSSSKCQFMVKVVHQSGYRTIWQLHRFENGRDVLVLEHTTNDVLLIHNLMVNACGHSGKEVNADSALLVTGPQRDVSRVAYVSSRGSALISDVDGKVFKNKSDECAQTSEFDQLKLAPPQENLAEARNCEQRRVMAALFGQTALGVLNQEAFLYLLQQEFGRATTAQRPLSILVLQIFIYAESPDQKHSMLPMQAYVEAIDRINKIKADAYSLARLDQNRLVLVLPDTSKEAAKSFATIIEREILKSPLCVGISPESLNVSVGVATAPGDGLNVQPLLARACVAQCKAKAATARPVARVQPTKPSLAKVLHAATNSMAS